MEWSGRGTVLRYVFLISILVALALSDELSEEKSYCTADSCDVNEDDVQRISLGTDEERETGIQLAYACAVPNLIPEEEVPVIFLHGAMDSRKTWNGIYQNIPILTHRKACVYDARNHGDSGWNDTSFTVDTLAEDLGHFMHKNKIQRAVLVGHSMGGLTAMRFALKNPSKVDRLFVEDISPISIPKPGIMYVTAFTELLRSSLSVIPEGADESTAKQTVVAYLREATQNRLPEVFARYIPLHRRDGMWQWKTNMDIFTNIMEKQEEFLGKPEGLYDGKAFFIYGKSSMFGVAEHEKDIRKYFPNSDFFGVEGADHFLHSVHSEFVTKLIKFLE